MVGEVCVDDVVPREDDVAELLDGGVGAGPLAGERGVVPGDHHTAGGNGRHRHKTLVRVSESRAEALHLQQTTG